MEQALAELLLGAIINGLVTWRVVKATLAHLAQGVGEAKADAKRAHERIDGVLVRAA